MAVIIFRSIFAIFAWQLDLGEIMSLSV